MKAVGNYTIVPPEKRFNQIEAFGKELSDNQNQLFVPDFHKNQVNGIEIDNPSIITDKAY